MSDSTAAVRSDKVTRDHASPFILYRHSLDTYRQALDAGLDDRSYVDLVDQLDQRLAPVAGTGFRTTPMISLDGLVEGETVWAKIETDNVGGSHKARHLFGLLLQIAIDEYGEPSGADRPLAIASCGNAAMGAAVIARAVDRELLVFVPTDANPVVLSELDRLGANVQVCERTPGQLGDPCLSRLDDALGSGARPFTVQGPICPGVIDGGRTLGLELADQWHDAGVMPTDLYIQIGGGAFATATLDGLTRSDKTVQLPRLHPVQPETAHPYVATWQRLRPVLAAVAGLDRGARHRSRPRRRFVSSSQRRAVRPVDRHVRRCDGALAWAPGQRGVGHSRRRDLRLEDGASAPTTHRRLAGAGFGRPLRRRRSAGRGGHGRRRTRGHTAR